MLKIDKFFAKEKMVVLLPKDNEYENYLAQQKKEQEEMEKTFNDLDDFFLDNKDIKENVQVETQPILQESP